MRLLLVLLLTGCAHTWNPMDYGVMPGQPLGNLAAINELPDSEIEQICGIGKAGCVKEQNSNWAIYYRNGDECTLRHELSHMMNGLHHTVEYTQRVIANRPICP